ncbi:MAG: succinate dehydrogenase, hydrophobic membrane anchor protein, partial [Arenicellales bacterium]|nr:succinate dehydrogenase, hydrophobic membrane anchor protein [Arenicellales bacterium]
AKEHWRSQRETAVIVMVLGFWLIYQLLFVLPSFEYNEVLFWAAEPLNALILLLLSLFLIYHAELGVQVVIEDYISTENVRKYVLLLLRLLRISVVIVSIVSISSILIGGGSS